MKSLDINENDIDVGATLQKLLGMIVDCDAVAELKQVGETMNLESTKVYLLSQIVVQLQIQNTIKLMELKHRGLFRTNDQAPDIIPQPEACDRN